METADIKSMTLEEVSGMLEELGEKPYRARQLYQWMHQKLARGFEEMKNLPLDLREKLGNRFSYTDLKLVRSP